MTLIITCLAHEHIVQVADRRLTMPDGSLYDDDTNKAVYYCGRVAVAYTGLAIMEGKPTAEWIGSCMKDKAGTEQAMNHVASHADAHFQNTNPRERRLAVVAVGWSTLQGAQPPRPFLCVASNFLTDSWEWDTSAPRQMAVRTIFLRASSSHRIFVAGQRLTPEEKQRLDALVACAIAGSTPPTEWARFLGDAVRTVADGSDARATRVGKGLIIHLLSRKAAAEEHGMIVTPLNPDSHSFEYVSREGKIDPFQGAVIACDGSLLTDFKGGSIPPGGKGRIRTEMEESAQGHPIRVAVNESRFSSPCPFCVAEALTSGSRDGLHIVHGELPLNEVEAWVYCRGATGHLLLVQRAAE